VRALKQSLLQETIQEENMKSAELAKGNHTLQELQNRLLFDLDSSRAEKQNLKIDLQKSRDALDSSQKECNRLETEISKLQDDLMAASALLDDRMEKDDKAAERQRDMRRKMEEQQKHNEELLELLQSQQSSLFKNSQDLAEYEGVLVKMAAELDEYRKVCAHTRTHEHVRICTRACLCTLLSMHAYSSNECLDSIPVRIS
jgi:chromosome segregation ATPase